MANVRGKSWKISTDIKTLTGHFLKQLIYIHQTLIRQFLITNLTQLTNTKASDIFFIILF